MHGVLTDLHGVDGQLLLRGPLPPDVIALAVRSYLRYRLSDADVAEWLAERCVQGDRSTIFDGVQIFAPQYQEVARPHRHSVGQRSAVDETSVKVAGIWHDV